MMARSESDRLSCLAKGFDNLMLERLHKGKMTCSDDTWAPNSLVGKSMLNKDPDKRPTATELMKIPLISTHIAKMSQEYQEKHNTSDGRYAEYDAEEIARTLQNKPRLDDLRKSEDDIKWKNLPPRERMRLKKMQQADKEARRLSEVARVQLIENQQRKNRIHDSLNKQSVPAWQGGSGEGEMFRSALTVKGLSAEKQTPKDFGTRSAPMVLYEEEEQTIDSTVIFNPLKTAGGPSITQYLPTPDERPITPLRDKMIYGQQFSSLDFKDGIPEQPDIANTYYSQFDEDFSPSDSDEDEQAVTVIPRKTGDSDDDADVMFGSDGASHYDSSNVTLTKKDDEDELFNHLQYVLDKNEDAENTMTLADDIEAGAFGPVARETKIKNLRAECEKMLGIAGFEKAYGYLKTARYERPTEVTEEDIMQGLREFVKNPSDCFLVDQLLFLEEQHSSGLS